MVDWAPFPSVVVWIIKLVCDLAVAGVVALVAAFEVTDGALVDAAPPWPGRVTTPPSMVVTIVTPAALVVVTIAPEVRVLATMEPTEFVTEMTAPGVRDTELARLTGPGPRGTEGVALETAPAALEPAPIVLVTSIVVADVDKGITTTLEGPTDTVVAVPGAALGVASVALLEPGPTGAGTTVDPVDGTVVMESEMGTVVTAVVVTITTLEPLPGFCLLDSANDAIFVAKEASSR